MITETIHDIKNYLLYSQKQRDFIRTLHVRRLALSDLDSDESKKNLINLYRDIFGHGGSNDWGEYLVCTSCKTTYSIEDIHDVTEYMHVQELPDHSKVSTCCGVQYEYYHTTENLLERLRSVIVDHRSDAFVLEDSEKKVVVGLIIGSCVDAHDVWIQTIKPKLVLAEEPVEPVKLGHVLYIDEIGIIKTYRKGIVPILLLLSAFFERMQEIDDSVQDILFWTSEASKVFKLIQQLPHTVLIRDTAAPPRVVVSLPVSKTVFRVKLLHFLYT